MSQDDLDELVDKVDLDNDGSINYQEFLTAFANRQKMLTQDRIWKTFNMIDRDRNGFITKDELRIAFEDQSEDHEAELFWSAVI